MVSRGGLHSCSTQWLSQSDSGLAWPLNVGVIYSAARHVAGQHGKTEGTSMPHGTRSAVVAETGDALQICVQRTDQDNLEYRQLIFKITTKIKSSPLWFLFHFGEISSFKRTFFVQYSIY